MGRLARRIPGNTEDRISGERGWDRVVLWGGFGFKRTGKGEREGKKALRNASIKRKGKSN